MQMEWIRYVLTEYTMYLSAAWMGLILILMVVILHRINKVGRQQKKNTKAMQEQLQDMLCQLEEKESHVVLNNEVVASLEADAKGSQDMTKTWTKDQEKLINAVLGEVFP